MRTDINITFFNVFVFLGVFQGLLLSWFFIKNSQKKNKANLFQGLLLLSISLGIFEEFLNDTGFIVNVLPISNFAEPLNFVFVPLFYFYIRTSVNPNDKAKAWPHFILALFWLLYMTFYFVQPDEVKYNSYLETKHPDWAFLNVYTNIDDDPLGIRRYCNELTALHYVIYMIASVIVMAKKFKSSKQGLFKTDNEQLIVLRNIMFYFSIIVVLFLATKLYYGMRSDIGGYLLAAYITFLIYLTSYQALNSSEFFKKSSSFLSIPLPKYQKSSLSEDQKQSILKKINSEMSEKLYYANNLASLSDLARQINESSHHVSQVINEKLSKNFFELLATYRVNYAKKLIKEDKKLALTIEEIAEQVGYNSKSSFNNAFKKITGQTPSEYRKYTTD